MKKLFWKLIPFFFAERLIALNEAAREMAFAATNEINIGDEWMLITPYGDFPNKVGLQRITKQDADKMVAGFNSLRGKMARAFMGAPIYVGHPDVDPDNYPDRRRYGKITDLESRTDGLYGKVAWNDIGQVAINQGHYLYNSPAWYLVREGKFVRPVELISVGLTNTPNISGSQPWARNETPTESKTMPEWLKTLLVAAKLMKADGTEDEAQTAVNSLVKLPARVTELETSLTTATNEKATVTTERDSLKTTVTTLTTERDTLKASNSTLSKARVDRELEIAVNSGRIKESDRAAWNDKLVANFETGIKDLHVLKPGINTTSKVGELGNRKNEVGAGSEKIVAINNAVRKYAADHRLDLATNEGHNTAFAGVKQEQPALFQ